MIHSSSDMIPICHKSPEQWVAPNMLTTEQIAELQQAFNLFDVDQGGTINSKVEAPIGWMNVSQPTKPRPFYFYTGAWPCHEKSRFESYRGRTAQYSKWGFWYFFWKYPFWQFLSQYDTDYSGQIEFPEFCNMMEDKMTCVNDEEMIRMAFRVLDRFGNGTISSKNFKHLMTHIGEWSSISKQ